MTQHTQGPWRVSSAGTNCRGGIAIQGAAIGDEIVAEVRKVWDFTGGATNHPADDRQKANASLIAAAPELLALLKEVAAAVDKEKGLLPSTVTADQGSLRVRVYAAIAKAEGLL